MYLLYLFTFHYIFPLRWIWYRLQTCDSIKEVHAEKQTADITASSVYHPFLQYRMSFFKESKKVDYSGSKIWATCEDTANLNLHQCFIRSLYIDNMMHSIINNGKYNIVALLQIYNAWWKNYFIENECWGALQYCITPPKNSN